MRAWRERRIFAAATIARSLPTAVSRGRYFMPQSGARITFSALMYGSARWIRAATISGRFDLGVGQVDAADHQLLAAELASTEQSSFDCAVSIETCRQLHSASSGRKE